MNQNQDDNDEDLEPLHTHFHVLKIDNSLREKQLEIKQFRFTPPPRTDSFPSLNIFLEDHAESINQLSKSSHTGSGTTSSESITIIPSKVKEALKKFSPTPIIQEAVNNLLSQKNVILSDFLTPQHLMIISSFLSSNPLARALIVTPSSQYSQWVRSNLLESTAFSKEDRSGMKKVLSSIRTEGVRAFICPASRLCFLPPSSFSICFVIKAELVENQLLYLSRFSIPTVFHTSPGFSLTSSIIPRFNTFTLIRNPELFTPDITIPEVLESTGRVSNDISILQSVISSQPDLKTAIIVPFKKMLDDICSSQSKIKKYSNGNITHKVIAGTTSLYYQPLPFEHYIFYGFPPSLGYLLNACIQKAKVTIIEQMNTAQRLQYYVHGKAPDLFSLRLFLNVVLKEGKGKNIPYFNSSRLKDLNLQQEIDLNQDGLMDLAAILIKRNLIAATSIAQDSAVIRIIQVTEEMGNDAIISQLLKHHANKRGDIFISLCELANSAKVSIELALTSLEKYDKEGSISFHFDTNSKEGSTILYNSNDNPIFSVLFDNEIDQNCEQMISEISTEVFQLENSRIREYDLLYSALHNDGVLHQLIDNSNVSQIEVQGIPYHELDLDDIKKFIKLNSREKLAPRCAAKVLLGIISPGSQIGIYGKTQFWSSLSGMKFEEITQAFTNFLKHPELLDS